MNMISGLRTTFQHLSGLLLPPPPSTLGKQRAPASNGEDLLSEDSNSGMVAESLVQRIPLSHRLGNNNARSSPRSMTHISDDSSGDGD